MEPTSTGPHEIHFLRSVERRDTVNDKMTCASKQFVSMSVVLEVPIKTANVVRSFVVHITVTSVCLSIECARNVMLRFNDPHCDLRLSMPASLGDHST